MSEVWVCSCLKEGSDQACHGSDCNIKQSQTPILGLSEQDQLTRFFLNSLDRASF